MIALLEFYVSSNYKKTSIPNFFSFIKENSYDNSLCRLPILFYLFRGGYVGASAILYADRVIVAISFLIKAFNCKFLLSAIRSAGSVKTLFFCYKFLFKYSGKQLNCTEQNRLSESVFKRIKTCCINLQKSFSTNQNSASS